ncbi:MAG: DUF58 domain-containing protein [Desulfobacterales bacterium]|nr:MAG: DUF58 domain-containing protein [Desulfobacterales bacterium]
MDPNQYRLPTALIIPLIQFFVLLLLFISLLTDQLDMTVLTLVVIAIVAGTKFWSRLSPAKIRCASVLNKQRVFPGETLILSTRVQNAKVLPVLAQLSVSFSNYLQLAENSTSSEKECSLLWYQEADFQWHLTALRRGVYQIGTAQVRVGDLFGFYSRAQDTASSLDIIVYPRLIPLKPVALPRRDFFGIPAAKSPIDDPVYVYGTREYQSGRPARYIHWKASARFGQLQEKICEPAAQEKILLMIDVTRFAEQGAHAEFERMLEVAASAAVLLDRSGFAMGLVTNGTLNGEGPNVLPIGRGPRQVSKILETLARLQMTPMADLTEILRRGLRLPWGTTGFSLSYEPGESFREITAFFKQRRVPVVSVVCGPHARRGADQKSSSSNIFALEDILKQEPV